MYETVPMRNFGPFTRYALSAMGLWPGFRYTVLSRCVWIVTMAIAQYFQYLYIYEHIASDTPADIVDSLSTTVTYSLISSKLFVVWIKYRLFRDLLSDMEGDWSDGTLADWDEYVMMSKANLSQRCVKGMTSIYWTSCVFYVADIVLSWLMSDERRFIMKMEFPMDSTVSPTYEIIVLVQFVQQLAVVTVEGVVSGMILTMIFHAGSQVDILRKELYEITSKNGETCERALKLLICRHHKLISFSENVRNLYSTIALMNFLFVIVILCLIGFVIVISMDAGEGPAVFAKFLPYYAAISFIAFIPCFIGEYISTKSMSIGDAAYETQWYNLNPDKTRDLMLIILRSQRPLTITAGKFVELSLECFLTIIKMSASYVSVLHAMY